MHYKNGQTDEVTNMSHDLIWTEQIIAEFTKLACLNEVEQQIIRMRANGYTIREQAITLNISEPTVSAITSKLKRKYDIAQKHSSIMPKRDTHNKYKPPDVEGYEFVSEFNTGNDVLIIYRRL